MENQMNRNVVCMVLLILGSIIWSCSQDSSGPTAVEVESGSGKVFIVDRTGKKWEVSHAEKEYGLKPSQYQFGLGPFGIRPILNPKMLSPGDPGYPSNEASTLIMATRLNDEARAYPISRMSRNEVAIEDFAGLKVAVAY
jgi:hypothetical protein